MMLKNRISTYLQGIISAKYDILSWVDTQYWFWKWCHWQGGRKCTKCTQHNIGNIHCQMSHSQAGNQGKRMAIIACLEHQNQKILTYAWVWRDNLYWLPASDNLKAFCLHNIETDLEVVAELQLAA